MKKSLGLIFVCMLLLCFGAMAEGLDISGCAYVDANLNGVCDGGEQLMSGVPVSLERMKNGDWTQVAQATTDEYGRYVLNGLDAGEYRVLCNLNGQTLYVHSIGGARQYDDGSAVQNVTLSNAAVVSDIGLAPSATLEFSAYFDSNADGKRGEHERNLANITVEALYNDQVMARATTNKKGVATLTAAPGEQTLRYVLPEGYGFTVLSPNARQATETVTLSVDGPAQASVAARPVGSFSGMAFEDMNNNGLMDEGEPGASGVTVHLIGQRTKTERTITTDETGLYFFDFLPDDRYTVTAELPEGMLYARYSTKGGDKRSIFTGSTREREFTVKGTAIVTNKNIGVVQKGVISGTAFFDLNYNGLWDADEPGYAGVTVEAIKISTSDSMGKVVTDKNGAFRLENLRGGDYRLRAILPDDGSIFSMTAQGTADQGNLFEQRGARRENTIQPLNIASGGEATALIGVARGAVITGTVFQDNDYNGRLNGKEKTFSGIKVRLRNEQGEIVVTDVTGKKGVYRIDGILPGTYTLEVGRKGNYGFTRLRPNEKGGSHITALVGDWGVTAPMEIAMAQEIKDVNAGMLPAATVSGSFFHDVNDNGLWDKDELGMVNAKVRLLSEDGEIDLYQTPAEDGSYFFDGVMPGKYTITYILPQHYEMARTVKGGNTVQHDGLETTTKAFTISMGDEIKRDLAGAVTLGSYEGMAFVDSNANGVMDADESPLAGAKVAIADQEVITAADGSFSIANLRPGEYAISMELPKGYIFSHDIDGLILANVQQASMACPWAELIDRDAKMLGAVKPASISGEVWMDENQDGAQADSEWIMTGLTLALVDEASNAVVDTVVTDENGFRFDNVRPGTYTVRFDLPAQSATANAAASSFYQKGNAMVQTGLAVGEGEAVSGLNTGLVSRTSIGGTAWLNENGQRSPVAGVTVALAQNGQTLQTAVTSETGAYRFDGLWPGEYTVTATLPSGMIYVRPDDPNYATGASVITKVDSGASDMLSLQMAQHQLERDILYIKPAKVGDIAWLDENQNGLLDGGERKLPGVTVRLLQNGAVAYETTTNAYGYYLFGDVYPGEYVLEASAYPELSITTPVESLRIISSCLTSGDGTKAQSDAFRVESGTTNANFDLGYILLDGQTLPQEALEEAQERDWTDTHINVGIKY